MPSGRMIKVVEYRGPEDDPIRRTAKAPSIFFACREARAEVIKYYKPVMGIDGVGSTWINFQEDTLCFRKSRFSEVSSAHGIISDPARSRMFPNLHDIPEAIRACITLVAVYPHMYSTLSSNWVPLRSWFKEAFPSISEILLAINNSTKVDDGVEHEIIRFEEEVGSFSARWDLTRAAKVQVEEAWWNERSPETSLPNLTMGNFVLGKKQHTRAPAQTRWMPNYRQYFD